MTLNFCSQSYKNKSLCTTLVGTLENSSNISAHSKSTKKTSVFSLLNFIWLVFQATTLHSLNAICSFLCFVLLFFVFVDFFEILLTNQCTYARCVVRNVNSVENCMKLVVLNTMLWMNQMLNEIISKSNLRKCDRLNRFVCDVRAKSRRENRHPKLYTRVMYESKWN